MKKTIRLAFAIMAALSLLAMPARAQDFPNHLVTVIAPYAPAGSIDLLARAFGPYLSADLKQPVIIDNRAGAGGKIGTQVMMAAKPDGHTISVINHAIATYLPAMDPNFNIAPGKDYLPVGLFAETYYVLVINPNAPFKTLAEMIDYAKKNPGMLNYATAGVGVGAHLGFERLAQMAGFTATHVPYKGEGPAIIDVMSGIVPVMFLTGIAKPYTDDKKLIPIATTNSERWDLYPDVPTIKEQGYPDYLLKAWYGFAVPKDTPPAIVARLNQAMRAAAADPEAKKKQELLGNVLKTSSPEELTKYINSDLERWTEVVKKANIKLE